MTKKVTSAPSRILRYILLNVLVLSMSTSTFAQLNLHDTLQIETSALYHTLLNGNDTRDTVILVATANDNNNVHRYNVTGKLFRKDRLFSFSINDTVLLNYEKWIVSPNNNISNTANGLVFTNFKISKDSANITAVSQLNTAGNPADITLQNFDASNIAAGFSKDTSFIAGLANGKITISGMDKKLKAITGNLSISSFSILNNFLGNMQATAVKQNDSVINTTVTILSNDNDINLQVNYYLNDKPKQFDAILNIKKFALANLQRFTAKYISQASGFVNGSVALEGKFNHPRWKGDIHFDTAKISINQFGTTYSIFDQHISLDYPFINFNQFTLKDSLNNPMSINGSLLQCSPKEYDLAIDLKTSSFNAINAPRAINNQLYGTAVIDAELSLSGTTQAPFLKGNISVLKNSEVSMVLPEKSPDVDAARLLVRFIDQDSFNFSKKVLMRPPTETLINFANFLNPDLRITIAKGVSLRIVIDPSAGDELNLQGDAVLKTGIDSAGNILLSGMYNFDSGYYELNYDFLKKRFRVLQGSTMQFAGDPANARINIRAEYIANTSPKELLGNEVGSIDPRIEQSFNQPIPFRVLLILSGSLTKPVVRFDIQLTGQKQINNQLKITIQNKLIQLRADTAATNKQVFALLALERFVGEQSTDFFKGNGGGFNDMTSGSVSRFLSDALDQIASDLFKGINIDLNLNSYKDFTTNNDAQKNDLNVDVSKNFLNDRLNVTVGKNFGIEGQDGSAKAAKQKGSRFLPDVTTNYKLSKDGKYMMKGYTKNQLEVVLDGYVVETGIGFLITMDYDKFTELFITKKMNDQ